MAVLGTDLLMVERDGVLYKAPAGDVPGLKANVAATLSAAFVSTIDNDGTKSSGTYTPSLSAGSQYKRIVNGGAFTLAPPSLATDTASTLSVHVTNNSSAGVISTGGFTQVVGDDFTSVDGDDFLCRIEVYNIAGTVYSFLNVVALQ